MAKSTQKAVDLGELVRRSEAARLSISQTHHVLKRKLDLPSRLKESLRVEPVKWIGGSILVGFVGSFLFKSRKRKRDEVKTLKKTKSSLPKLLRILVVLSKPAVKIYATKLLKDYVANYLARGGMNKPPGIERAPR